MAAGREHGREVERGRQHADDGVRLIVQDERGADDRGVGIEPALPESVPEHHRLRPVPLALLGVEDPADLRFHAEHVEEVVRHRHAAQALGLAAAAQQVVAHAIEGEVAGDCRQRLRALAQIQHVADLRRLPGQPAGVAVGDPDELPGLGERERPEQQCVDHAEHGRAGADAEAGDQHGKRGETGVAPQRADGVAQVLDQIVESHGAALDGVSGSLV